MKKMSFNAAWSMAVGGMVGGGIFSVTGVVINTAGQWAWLSFLLAGLIALASAFSYSQLSIKYREGGGAFTFLREINHEGLAGSLSWVLILGYILTISVYAFTFGHYVAHVLTLGVWFPRLLGLSVIVVLALVNLRGVGDASMVEIVTVWGKISVLLGLALLGITRWHPEALTAGIDPKPWSSAIVGAATIFMAYEGFQLLAYDYEALRNPNKTLTRASLSAVVSVIVIYILVTFGATMLVGAESLIEQEEVALSVAGERALGTIGLILVTIAAAFSTGSAINATLFSTGRLMESVAEKRDLPDLLARENRSNVPYYAVLVIAGLAALLSVVGSLGSLVESASLIFLLTFGTVNVIAYREAVRKRIFCLLGAIGCFIAVLLSSREQIQKNPVQLIIVLILILLALIGRPYLLGKWKNEQ
jgi:amino acid transporter